MPTRKALRHSRRRNTDLRVFYFLITYAITPSLVFQIIPYTIDMLRLNLRQKNTGHHHLWHPVALLNGRPNAIGRTLRSIVEIKLDPFGDRNHSI